MSHKNNYYGLQRIIDIYLYKIMTTGKSELQRIPENIRITIFEITNLLQPFTC